MKILKEASNELYDTVLCEEYTDEPDVSPADWDDDYEEYSDGSNSRDN